jgi:hypothetical protein
MARPQTARNLSRRVLVTIVRDQTSSTPRVVWQHEIPILEAIHGEGNVKPVDAKTLDEGYTPKVTAEMLVHNKRQDTIQPPSDCVGLGFVFAGDARSEYERLAEAYGKHREQDASVVQFVYGRFQEGRFAMVVGEAELEDMPDRQLRGLITGTGYLPDLHEKATPEERREYAEAHAAFNALPRADLVELAQQLGVMSFA